MAVTILTVLIILFMVFILWPVRQWASRDERNARTRYEVTEELDEQIRRRRK